MEILADNISCIRGSRVIFRGLSFQIKEGSAFGLVGPNGAGKTTLLRLIAGFLPTASGTIKLNGGNAQLSLQEQCHFVGHLNGVKPQLSVEENLRFIESYFGGRNVSDALDRFSLMPIKHIPAAYLSAGQKRRLGLARLTVVPRPIWLLDEPSVSLDQHSVRLLAALIKAHVEDGGIAIAATHVPLGVEFDETLDMGSFGAMA